MLPGDHNIFSNSKKQNLPNNKLCTASSIEFQCTLPKTVLAKLLHCTLTFQSMWTPFLIVSSCLFSACNFHKRFASSDLTVVTILLYMDQSNHAHPN